MASIFALLGVDLKFPDHSTVSRRAMSLESISKPTEYRFFKTFLEKMGVKPE